jgi:hypothetical protein
MLHLIFPFLVVAAGVSAGTKPFGNIRNLVSFGDSYTGELTVGPIKLE